MEEKARLKTIILKEKEEGERFNEYVTSDVVAAEIALDLKELFDEEKGGFPLSDKVGCGTISNAMALSTILELEDMGADISALDEAFRSTIKQVFDSVYNNGSVKFDATPYFEDDNMDSYVETASKVMIIMIDLRKYAYKKAIEKVDFGKPLELKGEVVDSFEKLAKKAEQLIIDATRFLNGAALRVADEDVKIRKLGGKEIDRQDVTLDKKIKFRGWAFTKPREGEHEDFSTSIYYTYHATNAYYSLYEAYDEIIEHARRTGVENLPEETTKKANQTEKELYKIDREFVKQYWKDCFDGLRQRTASAGRYIEGLLEKNGVDLAYDYVRSNFTGISSSRIIDSKDANAAINTLFVVAIYLNAGVDEDYEWVSSQESDVAKNKDWFYNQMQFAMSNVRKIYNSLKVNRRQDLIDSFKLRDSLQSDKYPERYQKLVQDFRNQCAGVAVAVYDLVPLLCNTYSTVFDYLIKYPQSEMGENRDLVLENRVKKEGKEIWLWGDANGFNANNNLYYVFALENFYDYYNHYEFELSGNEKKWKEEYEKKIDKAGKVAEQEKNELNQKIADWERKFKNKEKELENKKSALDEAVTKLFDDLFEGKLVESLEKLLNEAADYKTKEGSVDGVRGEFENKSKLRIALALYGALYIEKDFTTYVSEHSGDGRKKAIDDAIAAKWLDSNKNKAK